MHQPRPAKPDLAATPPIPAERAGAAARNVALFRYALIREVADPGLSSRERGRLVRLLAAATHRGSHGQQVRPSRASLDRWIRAWWPGGFEALLPSQHQPSPRSDAEVGQPVDRPSQ
ncbi:MAG: hypothetical protein ACYCXA_13675 [Actinomycetes bacterium]